MTTALPRETADRARYCDADPDPAEHMSGYALMGQPFRSGHYLAFRHFFASSIGPEYRAVWLRTPDMRWTIFADTEPERSCMRYIGSAVETSVTTPIEIEWDDSFSATVRVPGRLEWRFELGKTPMTRLVTLIATAMPDAAWRSGPALGAMGGALRPMLRAGAMRLRGSTPNGQSFQFRPERVWRVTRTTAIVSGANIGAPGPLHVAERLADLRMPQRGLFTTDLTVRYPSATNTSSTD
jgi:hypothetical protein